MTWFLENTTNEYWAYHEIFSVEECDAIIQIGNELKVEDGVVATSNAYNYDINKEVRTSSISWMSPTTQTEWIYRKCTDVIIRLNQQFFNFDLSFIENLQFTRYYGDDPNSPGGFYSSHIDTSYQTPGSNDIRKLSFSIQLTDSSLYEGGDLVLYHQKNGTKLIREIGIMNAFPSWTLHEVTPVTRGVRYSLVGWVHGPKFK